MSNGFINLTKLIADNNLLNVGMTVSANIPVRVFGDAAVVRERSGVILKVNTDSIYALFDTGKKTHTKFEDVVSIEGMEVSRFAQAYKIKTNKKSK
jgi:hypothetical protein